MKKRKFLSQVEIEQLISAVPEGTTDTADARGDHLSQYPGLTQRREYQ